MSRAHIVFKGKVQGVFFRANCQRFARDLSLLGWVRNLKDGNVEAVVEGTRNKIELLIEMNKKDQPYAKVTGIDIKWEEETNEFSSFDIIR